MSTPGASQDAQTSLANAGSEPPASGHITPRCSWPRPATPTDLVPNWAGEFVSFDDWVNFAKQRLTGTYDPLMGSEVQSVCVDALGRRCTMGGHFMRARNEGAFPVRFFWDCSPRQDSATPDLRGALGSLIQAYDASLRDSGAMARAIPQARDALAKAGTTARLDPLREDQSAFTPEHSNPLREGE